MFYSQSFYARAKTFELYTLLHFLVFLSILPANKSNKLYLFWLLFVISEWLWMCEWTGRILHGAQSGFLKKLDHHLISHSNLLQFCSGFIHTVSSKWIKASLNFDAVAAAVFPKTLVLLLTMWAVFQQDCVDYRVIFHWFIYFFFRHLLFSSWEQLRLTEVWETISDLSVKLKIFSGNKLWSDFLINLKSTLFKVVKLANVEAK